ncbi:protein phosphatase 2C domain-containing protein [Pedobacter frigoris]|uniref:Serine/threonine-protein phosphatase n=1 Tax=Pedobacter frigoris TaxID=2571272 RepID=A0A4U1CJ21_9SPHI|nr:protein phosphatase 2C domain-containing protein [Pedobacter frigoris]TKC06980.1 serine/threonine-protein phosphatase [Pedobacter frigoris]
MEKNYFGLTDTGKVRDNNEDTFIAERTIGIDYIISCVIDGVGGYAGGEIASAIARQCILKRLKTPSGDLTTLMREAIVAADAQIMAEKQKVKEHESMACVLTLAVVDLKRNQFHYAHVGDTRLYLLRDNSLVKISKDQSFVGFMEDSGRLTEEQAMKHPKRNEINKALGFGSGIAVQEDYIEMGQSPFLPGDLLLLCSDGLSDMVNRQEITQILVRNTELKTKAEELIVTANKNGGLDNITVVLVKNDNESLVHEATKPIAKPERKPQPNKPVLREVVEAVPVSAVAQQAQDIKQEQKSNKGIITLLSVLCLVFLLLSVYLLWQTSQQLNNVKQHRLTATKNIRNPQEVKLQDTINNVKGNVLILSDSLFKSPIILTEALLINRDTLFIKAKGNIAIQSDSAFKGSAIVVKPAGKYIYLENLTFDHFNTAISSQNNALVLKNIRFVNCQSGITAAYQFAEGKFVNGQITRSTFKTDSLAKP